jgi:hypothetical protein
MSELSQLSGVKRKSDLGAVRAAFDPERTFSSLTEAPKFVPLWLSEHIQNLGPLLNETN